MLSKSTISTSNPSGTVSSITYAHPPETVTNIFFFIIPHWRACEAIHLGWGGQASVRPAQPVLAAPTRTATAHALVATAVSHHDRSADVATGSISEVD